VGGRGNYRKPRQLIGEQEHHIKLNISEKRGITRQLLKLKRKKWSQYAEIDLRKRKNLHKQSSRRGPRKEYTVHGTVGRKIVKMDSMKSKSQKRSIWQKRGKTGNPPCRDYAIIHAWASDGRWGGCPKKKKKD